MWALTRSGHLDRRRSEQGNFDADQALRMNEAAPTIEIHTVDRTKAGGIVSLGTSV